MIHWHAKPGSIAIGIDIGWSQTSKSCALAIRGCEADAQPKNWTLYAPVASAGPIRVGLFRLDGLLAFLTDFLHQLNHRANDMVVVVDGPVGPGGPPRTDRQVDAAFTRGAFNRRMQPSAVTSKDGPRYVAVTRRILDPFFRAAGGTILPPWPFAGVRGRFVYAETHPTVGLALLVPRQEDATSLPSRRRPFRTSEQTFRAKSDWYWHIGARRRVADALRSPRAADETHHERVAGLCCLAVAEALARHLEDPRPSVAAAGGEDGVYVIFSDIAADWEAPVRGVGVRAGELRPAAAVSCEFPEVFAVRVIAPVTANQHASMGDTVAPPSITSAPRTGEEGDDADEQDFKGDTQLLVLSDNGGIWERHNDWLVELDEPVCVKTLDAVQEVIRFKRARAKNGGGQWVPVNKGQTTLNLARARGYLGKHLKKNDSVAIEVVVLPCSAESQGDARED